MADIPEHKAKKTDPNLEGIELDDDVEVFDIGMFEGGAEGSGFHMKNNPKDPYQRKNMIERTGSVDIRVALVDVVHGYLSTEDLDSWATLMVILIRFDPQKNARRVEEATIELTFGAQNPNDYTPEVVNISFNGHYSFLPSEQKETIVKSVDGSIGASYGADAKVEAKWEKTAERQTTDATTISGGIYTVGGVEPNRVAKWTLLENETLNTGVPATVRVGVLIKRLDEKVFTCMPKLKCKADKWTSVETVFSKIPKDDPVLLKPDAKATNKLMVYDLENLEKTPFDKLSDVTFTTMIADALKTHQQPTSQGSQAGSAKKAVAGDIPKPAPTQAPGQPAPKQYLPTQPAPASFVSTQDASTQPTPARSLPAQSASAAPLIPAQPIPTPNPTSEFEDRPSPLNTQPPTSPDQAVPAHPSIETVTKAPSDDFPPSTLPPDWKEYVEQRLQNMEKAYNDKLAEAHQAYAEKLTTELAASRQAFRDDMAVQMTTLTSQFDQSIAHLQAIADQIRQTWSR
ncbi:hypothetical protein GQ53DRAFT_754610 [Thozetella sp. PMI_491]|nr:hypothetical protein GQ53DRAFT_754610 [Thozetella sp. PMI_491]